MQPQNVMMPQTDDGFEQRTKRRRTNSTSGSWPQDDEGITDDMETEQVVHKSSENKRAKERERRRHISVSIDDLRRAIPPRFQKDRLNQVATMALAVDYIKHLQAHIFELERMLAQAGPPRGLDGTAPPPMGFPNPRAPFGYPGMDAAANPRGYPGLPGDPGVPGVVPPPSYQYGMPNPLQAPIPTPLPVPGLPPTGLPPSGLPTPLPNPLASPLPTPLPNPGLPNVVPAPDVVSPPPETRPLNQQFGGLGERRGAISGLPGLFPMPLPEGNADDKAPTTQSTVD